jgi:hypothetical protein
MNEVNIGGNSIGNIAMGRDIKQGDVNVNSATTEEDRGEALRLLAELRARLADTEVDQAEASVRIRDLEGEIQAEQPKDTGALSRLLTTLAGVESVAELLKNIHTHVASLFS